MIPETAELGLARLQLLADYNKDCAEIGHIRHKLCKGFANENKF